MEEEMGGLWELKDRKWCSRTPSSGYHVALFTVINTQPLCVYKHKAKKSKTEEKGRGVEGGYLLGRRKVSTRVESGLMDVITLHCTQVGHFQNYF